MLFRSHERKAVRGTAFQGCKDPLATVHVRPPGARRESLEHYLLRVRTLEDIANSQTGVVQSYALQAGREVRIFVRPEEIDDLAATTLARDIAKQIEESMQYPGQIKVTVIRETRAIDYAK